MSKLRPEQTEPSQLVAWAFLVLTVSLILVVMGAVMHSAYVAVHL
jgi:hypothetical protein